MQSQQKKHNDMKSTSSKFATMRRYLNLDYIFAAVGLAGCAALVVAAVDILII